MTDTAIKSEQKPMAAAEIMAALAAPFDPTEIKWKPAAVSGNRALALAYVDARVIQDRLDDVLGINGWQDDYEFRPDGSVICRLRLRIGDEWIQKVDVGGESEQQDGGDRAKAAVSDALKRAAVKFGLGRFLYRLPQQWVDYDPQKRHFTKTPTLPASLYAPTITAKGDIVPPASEVKPEPPPIKYVTVPQGNEIAALLESTKADYDKFMEWLSAACGHKVENIARIPAAMFEKAKRGLEKKAKEKAGAK